MSDYHEHKALHSQDLPHFVTPDPQDDPDPDSNVYTKARLESAWSILVQAGYENRTVVVPATLPGQPHVVGAVLTVKPGSPNHTLRLRLLAFLATPECQFIADAAEIQYVVQDREQELRASPQQYLLLRLTPEDYTTIMEAVLTNENFYKEEGLPIPASGSDAIGRAVAEQLKGQGW